MDAARAAERQQATAQQEGAEEEIRVLRWQLGDRNREVDELAAEVGSLTQQRDDAKAEIADWQRRNANQVGIIAGFSHDVTEARKEFISIRTNLLNERNEHRREIDRIKEMYRLRQAAITAASLANTAEGVAQRLSMDHVYWSPGYQDVCDVVDREMNLRAQLAEQLRIVADHWAVIEAQRADLITLRGEQ